MALTFETILTKFDDNTLTRQDIQMLMVSTSLEQDDLQKLANGKSTSNCDEKIESDDWIVKNPDILQYEKESVSAKDFIDRIYQDKGYIEFFGTRKVLKTGKRTFMKRGNKAINWRENDNGPFINDSLHKINNIYDNLGKRKWCKEGKKGEQKPVDVLIQCQFITTAGTQCIRKRCENSNMCTQHFKLSLK